MPPSDILHGSFVPNRDLTTDELNYLAVDGSKDSFKALLEYGNWSGTSYASFIVRLFADNSRIDSVALALGGKLEGNFAGACPTPSSSNQQSTYPSSPSLPGTCTPTSSTSSTAT